MADEQKNTNVNPATPVTQNQNIPSAAAQPAPQTGTAPKQTQGEAPKAVRTSALIQNPPLAEEAPKQREEELAVPQATLNEMEAGRRALERNKPVFVAREQAAQDAQEAAAARRQG